MVIRSLVACALIVALVGCSSPTAAPTTPPSPGGSTPPAAAPSAGGATATPAAGTGTPAAGNSGGLGGSGGSGSVSGTWSGTWTKPAGGGAITLQLQQAGATVSGTVTMVGSACIPPGATLTGTIAGPNIVLTVTGSGFQAMLGGEVEGNKIVGTLNASCSLGAATGTWQVTRS